MKFLLVKKKLAITITGEDLFNAQKPFIAYYSNGIKNTVRSYHDTSGFRIGMTYKQGNKLIIIKQRSFGNEEERNRAIQPFNAQGRFHLEYLITLVFQVIICIKIK